MPNEPKSPKVSEIAKDLAKSFDSSVVANWYSNIVGFLSGSRSFYVLLAITGLVVFVSSMAALNAINTGYRHTYNVTREIPWVILISTYVFLL